MRTLFMLVMLSPLVYAAGLFAATNYGGEVATIYTRDSAERVYQTQVWLVENRSDVFLRANDPNSKWVARLIQNPEVELERGGNLKNYRARPMSEHRARVNGLMAERYSWADWLVGLVFDRENAVPIALRPVWG